MSFDRTKNSIENAIEELNRDKETIASFADCFKKIAYEKFNKKGDNQHLIISNDEWIILIHEFNKLHQMIK